MTFVQSAADRAREEEAAAEALRREEEARVRIVLQQHLIW